MKKSLIALAVLAASGAASAQSSVQLYGVADVWLGSAKTSNDVRVNGNGQKFSASSSERQTKLDSGGVSTSRWGLKGSEDLGAGLRANFQLEQGLALDTGSAGDGFNRVATVGFSSGLGAVTLGKQYTVYDDIRGVAENTFDANISASKGVWTDYNDNTANTIKYVSPSFGGFSGGLSYAFGEDKNTDADKKNSASSVLGLSLQYANGPLLVGYGYQKEKEGTKLKAFDQYNALAISTIDAFGSKLGLSADEIAAAKNDTVVPNVGPSATYNLLTASYNLGVAKLVGSYNRAKLAYDGSSVSAKEYQFGVEVPVAANLAIGAGYAHSKFDEAGEQLKNTGFSIAAVYSLSKRTAVYAAAKQAKQEYTYSETGYSESASSKTNIYAVGVKHTF